MFFLTIERAYGIFNVARWSIVAKTLLEIRQGLEDQLGRRLRLKANRGRRKTIERSGVLAETYPSVFVVELDQDENAFERVSYSYAEVLTESVELSFLDDKEVVRAVHGIVLCSLFLHK